MAQCRRALPNSSASIQPCVLRLIRAEAVYGVSKVCAMVAALSSMTSSYLLTRTRAAAAETACEAFTAASSKVS
jgi:hypothetical protein